MSYLDTVRKTKEELKQKQAAADITEGPIVAVLIDSTVLGAEIWFALDDDWRPDLGDSRAVFYASELSFLQTKSPETLREIHKVKLASGGMVKQ